MTGSRNCWGLSVRWVEKWVSHNGLGLLQLGLVQLVVLLGQVGQHSVHTQVVLLQAGRERGLHCFVTASDHLLCSLLLGEQSHHWGLTAEHSKYWSPFSAAKFLPAASPTTRRAGRSVLLATRTPAQG